MVFVPVQFCRSGILSEGVLSGSKCMHIMNKKIRGIADIEFLNKKTILFETTQLKKLLHEC